ncbi:PA14 domain-containing protein, partial [Paenibacillus larvae]
FQSILWTGYIKPSETNDYLFSTSDDEHVALKIDEHIVLNGSEKKEHIHLKQNELYKIVLEYKPKDGRNQDVLDTFKVFWAVGKDEKVIIPKENLILPTSVERSKEDRIIPTQDIHGRSIDVLTRDTDDDGIPDEWEINGYTVVGRVVVKWDEGKHAGKYKKFVSDPYDAHTAGDPYTDYEKAAGIVDKAISRVALNPLVPAYPSVGVAMEKFVISKNQDVEVGSEGSLTISNGSSTENSVTTGIDVSINASLFDFGASVSTSFSKTTSHTLSTEKTEGKSWSESIGINTAESAYFNGNIRYFNRGTAPMYNVLPTMNLILDKGKNARTLYTVKAQENHKAQVIGPGRFYPDNSPISLRTMDESGSTPMSLNYNELKDVENGAPFSLETTQVGGDYIKVVNGDQSDPMPWTYWLTQIEYSSARIILSEGDTETERRITARSTEDYDNETKPEVTLGEALELTFGIEQSDRPTYNGDSIQYIFDENTAKDIEKQLKDMGDKANLQNVKLKAGMQIMIQTNLVHNGSFKFKLGGWQDEFNSAVVKENEGPNSENVLGFSAVFGAVSQNLKVIPNTNYTLSFLLKEEEKDFLHVLVYGKEAGNKLMEGEAKYVRPGFVEYNFHFNSGKYNEIQLGLGAIPTSDEDLDRSSSIKATNFKITGSNLNHLFEESVDNRW